MAKGTVNKVFIIGNVGKPPEIKRNDKMQFANILLATMQEWNDKASGEKRERTEWHRIIIYGKLVNVVEKYVHKGDKISVIGRIQTYKYADDNGIEREKVDIIGEEVQILLRRDKNNEDPWA
jgi:single-strand DNA-binding protein